MNTLEWQKKKEYSKGFRIIFIAVSTLKIYIPFPVFVREDF